MTYFRGTRVIASSQAYPGVINVTIFSDKPPIERENGGTLRIGDRWWDDTSMTEYIWREKESALGDKYLVWQKITSDDSVYVGRLPLDNPAPGKLWFNSETSRLYIWYYDEKQDVSYWVNITPSFSGPEGPQGPAGSADSLYVGNKPPAAVHEGKMWFDPSTGQMHAARKDPITQQFNWIVISTN